jgi:hypothetical protein
MTEPEVVFNMDLANGRTGARFCYEAADVLELDVSEEDATDLRNETDSEYVSEIVDEWTARLETAGYYVVWNAGDVVVWDLRPLSDDEKDEFIERMSD